MVKQRTLVTWAAVVILGVVLTASANAWGSSAMNHLTFSGAVGLPNVTLPAGTYIFETAPGILEIVRVLNKDRSKVYYMGFTRSVGRPRGMKATVTFGEVEKGAPAPIAAWFPVGSSMGHEFVY
jgi:hypothetical protein